MNTFEISYCSKYWNTVIEAHRRHEYTLNTDIPYILKGLYRLIPVSSQPHHIRMSTLSLFIERSGHFGRCWPAREHFSPPLLLYLTLD